MNRLKLTTANRFKLTTASPSSAAWACLSRLPCEPTISSKASHLTINQPLKVEDTLLPPGEYVFKPGPTGRQSQRG